MTQSAFEVIRSIFFFPNKVLRLLLAFLRYKLSDVYPARTCKTQTNAFQIILALAYS